MAGRLLGRGTLTVHVLGSDGHTPIPGRQGRGAAARVPEDGAADVRRRAGVLVLGGGDALSEGEAAIVVRDMRNGFTGRASARIARDDEQVSVNVYIFDAWGTVSGKVYKPDGITPVPNAEVVISVGGKALGYAVTDATAPTRRTPCRSAPSASTCSRRRPAASATRRAGSTSTGSR